MKRPAFIALCYAALLVAVSDDWLAAQTVTRADDEAALLDNDFFLTPVTVSLPGATECTASWVIESSASYASAPADNPLHAGLPPTRPMTMRC
jgi:hypothetical protein